MKTITLLKFTFYQYAQRDEQTKFNLNNHSNVNLAAFANGSETQCFFQEKTIRDRKVFK